MTYPSLVIYSLAVLGDRLAIRLHISLLEIIRKLVEILIIRQQSQRLRTYRRIRTSSSLKSTIHTIKVIVPNSNQGQQNRQVLLQRRFLEMLVHPLRAAE